MKETEPLPRTREAAIAHGVASHSVMSWLHRRPLKRISLHRDVEFAADPDPADREAADEALRLLLSVAIGEMLHLRASSRHVDLDRPGVEKALLLAHRMRGNGDPADRLEPEFDAVLASLTSPRIWKAVRALASALLKRRALETPEVEATIATAMGLNPNRQAPGTARVRAGAQNGRGRPRSMTLSRPAAPASDQNTSSST